MSRFPYLQSLFADPAPTAPSAAPAPSASGDTSETRWRGASRMVRSMLSWIPGIGSGTSDLSMHEQRSLRARSRDAMRNQPIGRAALMRCRTNIVGTGLMCRPSVDHETLGITEEQADALNIALRNEFERWAEDPVECDWEATLDFYGQQALALLSAMASGDLFVLSPQQLRPGGVSELKLQMIEADRVCNPHEAPNSPALHDGVVLENGVPVGCWVRNVHPGDVSGVVLPQWTYYAYFGAETGRRRVLHVWNDKERPGQVRGAPYLAPILEPLKQMERYGSAELMAAVVSAMLTVFIERDKELAEGGDESALGEADAAGNIQLGNAAVVDLLPGEKANMANPLRPNANFDPFFVAWAKQVGAALELPLDELLLHYQSSYSAARAAMLQAWRFYTSRRWQLVQQFCQPAYALAVDEAVAMGRLRLPGYGDPLRRRAYLRAIWIGPARGAMDEFKEAQAAGKRIEIGVSNEAMECAAMQGEDWRGVYAQRRLEVARRRADGMYTPPGGNAPQPAPAQTEQTA